MKNQTQIHTSIPSQALFLNPKQLFTTQIAQAGQISHPSLKVHQYEPTAQPLSCTAAVPPCLGPQPCGSGWVMLLVADGGLQWGGCWAAAWHTPIPRHGADLIRQSRTPSPRAWQWESGLCCCSQGLLGAVGERRRQSSSKSTGLQLSISICAQQWCPQHPPAHQKQPLQQRGEAKLHFQQWFRSITSPVNEFCPCWMGAFDQKLICRRLHCPLFQIPIHRLTASAARWIGQGLQDKWLKIMIATLPILLPTPRQLSPTQ